ncbi:uncharacterized protein NEMAJ01_0148 [Nematocida major]|uniref:uncharacterized protein n=1 Tax=Nematocida major TaxID=1912982 RepID=UPI0020083820|nr:uncharacterized protein NEMAJ01_0148 [Nematocida major]KAH9385252.1 hypothetical protein NEMAJ01_0148 [Nematocida major]
MAAITAGLQKIIAKQKKRMEFQEKRLEEKHKKMIEAALLYEDGASGAKDEEDTKRSRRRSGCEKPFRGCTEEEAESDLLEIFGSKSDKYMHVLPDGKTMTVIKKQTIIEGDIIRIEKGDLFDVGVVKSLHKGSLVLEGKEKEKKYPISKLLSSRYMIFKQIKNERR